LRRSEEAKRWLSEAQWDLETAQILHDSRRYNSCAFICQQAGEKAAKALLYSIGESPFGHSVRELLSRYAEAKHESLEELLSLASERDRHYVPARYPNAIPSSTPHESYDEVVSRRALEYAAKIIEHVQMRLQ